MAKHNYIGVSSWNPRKVQQQNYQVTPYWLDSICVLMSVHELIEWQPLRKSYSSVLYITTAKSEHPKI